MTPPLIFIERGIFTLKIKLSAYILFLEGVRVFVFKNPKIEIAIYSIRPPSLCKFFSNFYVCLVMPPLRDVSITGKCLVSHDESIVVRLTISMQSIAEDLTRLTNESLNV